MPRAVWWFDVASTRGINMSEKSKRPNRKSKVFDLSWETDDDPEDAGHAEDRDPGKDDVEGHASGFNRPT
jgi:hypothetical protein